MDGQMIRPATKEDIPRLIAMGRGFLSEGPYKEVIEDNPDAATKLAEKLMGLPETARILVNDNEGHLTGLCAFIVYPHFYSGRPTAQELIWYLEPEARRSFDAICLLRATLRTARDMGAEYMQFTAPTPDVGKLYEMSGFSQIEVGYQRKL